MRNAILILSWLVILLPDAGAQYPVIQTTRPRIYADETRFDYLRTHNSAGECGATYTDFVNRYNNNWVNDPQLYLTGSDSSLWTWTWNSQWAEMEAFFTAFLFKLNGDALSLKRCEFIINRITQRLDTATYATMEWYAKEELIRTMADVGGVMLDWCYDSLPAAQRQHLAQSLYVMDREFMNTYILSATGNSYVSSHNAWNCIFANQLALVLRHSDGLSIAQNDTLQQWYEAVYDKWENGFFPAYGYYRDDDGGWNWGAAYSMWSLTDQFQMFENMRIATGKDYYHDVAWVQNSINQYYHFIQPDDYTIHLGDGITTLSADRVVYLHAREFQDGRSQWLAQEYSQNAYMTWTWPVFQRLFYKDFDQPAVTFPAGLVGNDWWADKVGWSVSRTGWDDTATVVSFFNSPSKRAAHEHRDNNSFSIYKHEPLLLDAGYYDTYAGSHYLNYYSRTVAHNCITVFDSTESYFWSGTPVSNDGGQIYSNALQNYTNIFEPQNQRGRWIECNWANNEFMYNVADATLSYDPAKVSRFRRALLFRKPNKVIVLDHLNLLNTATAQRDAAFVLHFAQQPALSGLLNSSVPAHIETFSGRDYTAANGQGNVAIRTLLPAATTTSRIGGAGYEYWVNGLNYPPQSLPPATNTPGSWRIEVKPSAVNDSLLFLHTIDIGDSSHPSAAGGSLLTTNVSIGVDWDDELFFFNAQGDSMIMHHLLTQVPGNRSLKLFAVDFPDAAFVDVWVDSVLVSNGITQAGAYQDVVTLGPGMHRIELNASGTQSRPDPATSQWVQAFPNPGKGHLHLKSLADETGIVQWRVFTAEGKDTGLHGLMQGSCELDLPHPGVFFIHLQSERKGSAVLRVVVDG